MKRVLSVLVVLSLIVVGCSDEESPVTPMEQAKPSSNIVEIAVSNPEFSSLVKAVVLTDLTGDLSGDQKLTVFAPVNKAFEDLAAALGYNNADELLVEENKELVKNVLLYHVAAGALYAENVVASGKAMTLFEQYAYIKIEDGSPYIGNENLYAKIINTDIEAKNGVIHVIDKVLLPL